jgi:hypothetical protein
MRLRQLEHKFVQQRRQQQQQHQQTGLCSSPVTMATGSTPTRTGNPCAANTGGHQALLQHSCQRAPPGAMASTRQAAPQPALSTAASEQQRPLMFDDIIQAHEAKSFDYRVSPQTWDVCADTMRTTANWKCSEGQPPSCKQTAACRSL